MANSKELTDQQAALISISSTGYSLSDQHILSPINPK